MLIIRNSWEKKCKDIQTHYKEENSLVVMRNQEKMRRELDVYVQDLKLGKNVIIKDSDQIINKKMEVLHDKYNN